MDLTLTNLMKILHILGPEIILVCDLVNFVPPVARLFSLTAWSHA